ncbi:DUF2188 domain-containing protein [Francisella adeliensis]|uniref:DUF2188 domain-containing protein n=1 Tax=Francisella adeliensis TaxID=2007306 RepID=A0A2Z4XZ62_9GAMM|nr:DUF2188 domain-containing protein [Francisella adeliensis]AXA34157.1 hypothetical protein CDH04_06965 [Francisella adeliensis]MBK2085534.1 DUF2188 domain-containing protein [Francisella adeliensis]MBK2096344.1 DUF2188 domain-containing protein [Francisella adeliensis]QIW12401.1 DUF2188 domain-containing protein [Francisella adeliensis]QIW14275.1 DUF2188 domain-containing protein [Francisella adeliensis]
MQKNKNYFVSPHPEGWQTKRAGATRASAVTTTQGDAFEIGRKLAKKSHGELSIQNRQGNIRDKRSYGNDPFPPKG